MVAMRAAIAKTQNTIATIRTTFLALSSAWARKNEHYFLTLVTAG
jgi:hypothetical protein